MEGFIGEIRMFAGNFAPRTWAFCEGQLLSIASNTALFSILGTTYGGDGRTTFGLPDMRGRVAMHAGTGPGLPTYRIGQKGGTEQYTITLPQMPSHNHVATIGGSIKPPVNAGNVNSADDPSNAFYQGQAEDTYADAAAAGEFAGALTSTLGFTLASSGHGTPVNNMQPYNVTPYIICLQGVYPSRS